jgi:hypothetical protein
VLHVEDELLDLPVLDDVQATILDRDLAGRERADEHHLLGADTLPSKKVSAVLIHINTGSVGADQHCVNSSAVSGRSDSQ